MEKRRSVENTDFSKLNFKKYLEMAHLTPLGKSRPFFIFGGVVKSLDMKFENYSDTALKHKLLLIDAQFYGKVPDTNEYLVFDGRNLEIKSSYPASEEYIKLPDNWYDFAMFEFSDGSIKPPSQGV